MAEMNVICLYDSARFSLLPQYKGFHKKKIKKTATNFQPSTDKDKYMNEQVKRKKTERGRERRAAGARSL